MEWPGPFLAKRDEQNLQPQLDTIYCKILSITLYVKLDLYCKIKMIMEWAGPS